MSTSRRSRGAIATCRPGSSPRAAVCVAAVVLAIVLHRFLGGPERPVRPTWRSPTRTPRPIARPEIARSGRPPDVESLASPGGRGRGPRRRPTSPPAARRTPEAVLGRARGHRPDRRATPVPPRLPEEAPRPVCPSGPGRRTRPGPTSRSWWSGGSPTSTDGHDRADAPARAWMAIIGATVELADDGPLLVDDLRMSGESRVIRARRGYRPIIRIVRSKTEAAREQSAFLPLDRKSVTLEGVDLLVDARDLSGRQKALFGCSGSNLTLRDCTITVINPTDAPFTLVRQEPASRPSRIRLERTLVRGGVRHAGRAGRRPGRSGARRHGRPRGRRRAADRAGHAPGGVGPAPLFPGGAAGVSRADRAVRSGRTRAPRPVGWPSAPSARRSAGSRGRGSPASWSRPMPGAMAERAVDWAGDRNLFAGWKGFFARGPEPTITVGSLAAGPFHVERDGAGGPGEPGRLAARGRPGARGPRPS